MTDRRTDKNVFFFLFLFLKINTIFTNVDTYNVFTVHILVLFVLLEFLHHIQQSLVISRRCLDLSGSSMLTFSKLPH